MAWCWISITFKTELLYVRNIITSYQKQTFKETWLSQVIKGKKKKKDSKLSLYDSKALVFPLCHVNARWLNVKNNELIDHLLMVFFVFMCQWKLSYNSVIYEVNNLALVLSRISIYWAPKTNCFQGPWLDPKLPNDYSFSFKSCCIEQE